MTAPAFEKLQVLLTGVDAAIARDVARLVVADGGRVVAADKDAGRLARLRRDLGLYRAAIETAEIDLASRAEVRLWEESLRATDRLPHLMICCCGATAGPASGAAAARAAQLGDVSLSERKARHCLAATAEQVLQPTLSLHALPLRQSAFDRALAVIRHPTLRGVLARAPGRGVFSPAGLIPYVRIASEVYSMRRAADGARPDPLRLLPPSKTSTGRANAA
jgi:hypothetical protein